LERWGGRNTAVTCELPQRISKHLGSFFDRVLVDAPCSGEGTFRSNPGEIKLWSPNFSLRCSQIQDEILWFAATLVKPGGVLVYSTCTFNQNENEGSIARFLGKNPDFDLDPINPVQGYSEGIQLENAPSIDFSGTVRIWPHRTLGEGHYVARLRKSISVSPSHPEKLADDTRPDPDHLRIYSQFFETALNHTSGTQPIQPGSVGLKSYGNRLYWIPPEAPSLAGLDVRHWGWWLGTIKFERFIPSPAMAYALFPEDAQKVLEFSVDDPNLVTYRRGSPIATRKIGELPPGWTLVTCNGNALGWGLMDRDRMKSYHPHWLRSI
jgi:NOL1/NOP2/fmu family ribosome biogenesis protein